MSIGCANQQTIFLDFFPHWGRGGNGLWKERRKNGAREPQKSSLFEAKPSCEDFRLPSEHFSLSFRSLELLVLLVQAKRTDKKTNTIRQEQKNNKN